MSESATTSEHQLALPRVRVIGDLAHVEFAEAISLLDGDANIVGEHDAQADLLIFAQPRSGVISATDVERVCAASPGVHAITLLGSWCEGEVRTGKPWPNVERVYWHQFEPRWRQFLAGRQPFEATAGTSHQLGLVVIQTAVRDTADVLTDVVRSAGYSAVWQPSRAAGPLCAGVVAGIWDGGQLDEREARALWFFCREMASHAAPVVVLLDFPRRDSVDRARQLGATTVIGKPWDNDDLLRSLTAITSDKVLRRGSVDRRAA